MSNLPESTLKSPKFQKISIKQIRNSPKVKNVLRQKWQERMKEKRNALFNGQRFHSDEEQDFTLESFTADWHKWMKEMEFSISGYDLESEADWEEWFKKNCSEEEEQMEFNDIQMFEDFLNSMAAMQQDSIYAEVICPMCQKNIMTEEPESIVCTNCKFILPAKMSLADFSNSIHSQSAKHSLNCNSCPAFVTIPENDTISLYLTCETCSCCFLIM